MLLGASVADVVTIVALENVGGGTHLSLTVVTLQLHQHHVHQPHPGHTLRQPPPLGHLGADPGVRGRRPGLSRQQTMLLVESQGQPLV